MTSEGGNHTLVQIVNPHTGRTMTVGSAKVLPFKDGFRVEISLGKVQYETAFLEDGNGRIQEV